MPTFSLQERIESSLSRSGSKVFLRREFDRFGGYDQVGRALCHIPQDCKAVLQTDAGGFRTTVA